MHWEVWLVPLIAMAVWILGSLLRGGVEERPRNAPRPNAGGPEGGRQRPTTDLDRFLQEVHRRRQPGGQREGESVAESPRPASPPERGEDLPRVVPPPARQPRRGPRPAPAPSVLKRPLPRQSVEEPVVLEVVVPAPRPPGPPPAVLPVAVVPAPPVAVRTPPATKTVRAKVPPRLAALLSSPESLRHAVMLREIFDPPLCKRRKS